MLGRRGSDENLEVESVMILTASSRFRDMQTMSRVEICITYLV